MLQRAYQALTKLALEPEWEAVFEPNSYGFRPGRSPHDAIEAVYNFIRLKPKYALKADIEKCFDKIDHQALLDKLCTTHPMAKLVRGWLKAGIVDQGQTLFPETGVPQGGVISPLLMNVALHGLEEELIKAYPKRHKPAVIRFADDVVILHHDLEILQQVKTQAEAWLNQVGLQLNPTKTHIAHTLNEHEGQAVGLHRLLGSIQRGFHCARILGERRARHFNGAEQRCHHLTHQFVLWLVLEAGLAAPGHDHQGRNTKRIAERGERVDGIAEPGVLTHYDGASAGEPSTRGDRHGLALGGRRTER